MVVQLVMWEVQIEPHCMFISPMCLSKCRYGPHVWEGIGDHNIQCEPTSYELQFLVRSVVQQGGNIYVSNFFYLLSYIIVTLPAKDLRNFSAYEFAV